MTKSEEPILSWEDFLEEIHKLNSSSQESSKETGTQGSEWLYRGQKNCKWHLNTTLERVSLEGGNDVSEYYDLVYSLKPRIETFTQKNWSLPNLDELKTDLVESVSMNKIYGHSPSLNIALFKYLTFLRHYGFPSPLLDWTECPSIAAFFAFHNACDSCDPCDHNVAVWAYREYEKDCKAASSSKPWIVSIDQDIKSGERHSNQKSNYTVCFKIKDSSYKFWSHEELLDNPGREPFDQDKVVKFVLDIKERKKILKILDSCNINSFSLFKTTESLMDTIATKNFLLSS